MTGVPTAEDIVRDFVAAINRHDAKDVVARCAPQHRFVDSLGNVITGRDDLRRAWTAYFHLFPDYAMAAESVLGSDSLVLMSGWASGTVHIGGITPATPWRIPAAWRAEVVDGLVVSWQVFADNKPVYDLLQRDG